MNSSLVLLCNTRWFVIDSSYSSLYLNDLSPVVSDIDFMINLLCYYILCKVRHLALVHWYTFHYSKFCSSMMSGHPKGGGSAWDTRVLLINVDVVSGLIKCCLMLPFHMVCRDHRQVVTALFCVIIILHTFG